MLITGRSGPVSPARLQQARSYLAAARQSLAQLQGWAPPPFLESLANDLELFSAMLPAAPKAAAAQQPAAGLTAEPIATTPHPASQPQLLSASQPTRPALEQQAEPAEGQSAQQVSTQTATTAEHCCLCGEAAPSPARCGRCRTTVYCGRRCQMEHWLGGHREECTRIVTERFNERVAVVARARAGRCSDSAAAATSRGTPDGDGDSDLD